MYYIFFIIRSCQYYYIFFNIKQYFKTDVVMYQNLIETISINQISNFKTNLAEKYMQDYIK